MNIISDTEAVGYIKELIQFGYDKAPAFCRGEPTTPVELLKALMVHKTPQTPREFLADVGAVKWCLEQLETQTATFNA